MIQIDLGCGRNKQAGFIGVDRYPFSGVDVLVNLNQILPFRDDSVDLIFASHSLEHVESLLTIMNEIYRICKHGAQLCVIAPYSEQKLNLANPYHHFRFNEHTPRFWTSYPTAPIDLEEFNHPQAPQWGLSLSDNSDPGIDIRLVRMEYFYFPQYAGLPTSEQRRLRKERMDVCDQIMYHLIVWKGDARSPAKSFDGYASEVQPFEPSYLGLLRQREPEALLRRKTAEFEASSAMLTELRNQLVDAKTHAANDRDRAIANLAALTNEQAALRLRHASEREEVRNEIRESRAYAAQLMEGLSRLHKSFADQTEVFCQMSAELHDTAVYNRILRDEASRIGRELESARSDLRRESAALAAAQDEAFSLREDLRILQMGMEPIAVLNAKLSLTQAELEATAALLAIQRQKDESLNAEVAAARRGLIVATGEVVAASQAIERWKALHTIARRSLAELYAEARTLPSPVVRVAGFVIGRRRTPHLMSDRFVAVRDYCDRYFHAARASLVLGGDLNEVSYREYEIPFDLDSLKSISLAIRPLLPGSAGNLGIEIVSSESQILVQTLLPLADVKPGAITEFRLPVPLTGLRKTWLLRVFVRGADAPVPLYELAKGALFRRETQFFPFVSFI
jgi:SAM-dependent methyltransferase